MSGYVRIYRQLLGHHAFRNDAEAMAFAWMVLRASWRDVRVRYKGQSVNLSRGQLAVSVRDLAENLDRPKGWVERLLTRLKNETMVETRAETGVTVITICNYDEFQAISDDAETPAGTHDRTDAGQPQDTEQRREIRERSNRDIYNAGARENSDDAAPVEDLFPAPPAAPEPPVTKLKRQPKNAHALPDDWEPVLTPAAQAVVDGWPPGELPRQLASFRDHAADKGRTSKDWQAAFRTWITNAEGWRKDRKNGQSGQNRSAPRTDGSVAYLERRIQAGRAAQHAGEAER